MTKKIEIFLFINIFQRHIIFIIHIYPYFSNTKLNIMSTTTNIFKLTSFSPVGIKQPNYPVQFCCLCRGHLHEVCSQCMEKNNEECAVTKDNDTENYYHEHCYTLINRTNKPLNAKAKAK